jgi:valyl-tRNA synthetase
MEDRWILSRLSQTVSGVNKAMADFQFAEAQRQIYDFLWSEFCDWYIELAKIRLRTTAEEVLMPLTVLVYVLETSLRLIHPYMPFLTEELWQNLKGHLSPDWQIGDSIMVAPYPEADANAIDPEAERVIESVIEIIRSIRNTRAQYSVDNARWVEAKVYGGRLAPAIAPYSQAIETLARARPVTIREVKEEGASTENTLVSVLSETEVVVPMESMVDAEAEMKRLEKEIEQGRTEVARLETRLENQDFLAKAPAPVVEKERQRCYALTDKLDRLEQQMSKYQGGEK